MQKGDLLKVTFIKSKMEGMRMRTKYVMGLFVALSLMIVSSMALAQEASSENADTKKLNLNIATLKELKALPGITQETAQAVIDHRPYEKTEDILKISGITKETLANIKEQVEVKKLNINTATISELKILPGITTELAEAIIEGRSYKIVEELLKIKGIGEKELAKLQGFIEAKPREEEEEEKKGWKTRKRNYPGPGK